MERLLGVSYPTIKSRLRAINRLLGPERNESNANSNAIDVLNKLEDGEINIDEAIKELKGGKE